jgi:hypothetical protein
MPPKAGTPPAATASELRVGYTADRALPKAYAVVPLCPCGNSGCAR